MYGPSVPVHLTPFMEGRGRPGGRARSTATAGAASISNVRRNFLNPMFLAFDMPVPFSTMGRRNVSNVPAQALTLMNDPLVVGQARLWAEDALAGSGQPPRHGSTGFTRPPSAARRPTDEARALPGVPREPETGPMRPQDRPMRRGELARLDRPLPCA